MNEAVRKALRMRSEEEANKILEGTNLKAEQRDESTQGYVTVYNDKVSYVISKDRNGKSNLFKHGYFSTLNDIRDLKHFDFENAFEVVREDKPKYESSTVEKYKRIKRDIELAQDQIAMLEGEIARERKYLERKEKELEKLYAER